MNNLEQVEGKLRSAMVSAKANGWTIVRLYVRGPSNSGKCACAVGSVVVDIPGGEPLYGKIAMRLGCQFSEVIAIARGFDGKHYDSDLSEPSWHHLGERLYSALQEGTL